MKTYPVGVAVTVTIPFVDLNGDPVVPTALSARVLDGDGAVVMASTAVAFNPGDTDADVTVPGNYNTVPNGQRTAGRIVELTITTAAGPVPVTEMYLVRSNVALTIPAESFQTYEQAVILASQMPTMIGWESNTPTDRINALMEAHSRLTKLGYRIRRPEDVDTMNYIPDDDEIIQPRYWPIMTVERWNLLPDRFKLCLRKAQIAEANEILRGDIVSEKRRSGLLSETIGESSMMFRTGKPIEFNVSSQSLNYLTGYIEIRITTTRS